MDRFIDPITGLYVISEAAFIIALLGVLLYKIWYDHNMAPKKWISIRNIIIYLETKFYPYRRIFVFWQPFWIQNGRHSKPKCSPYGAACLTPCKYPFPLNFFHFWIFNNLFLFFLFLYWQPFCPTDSDFFGLFRSTRCGCCFYQVSSIYVRRVTCNEHFCLFQFFSILAVSMATAAIF